MLIAIERLKFWANIRIPNFDPYCIVIITLGNYSWDQIFSITPVNTNDSIINKTTSKMYLKLINKELNESLLLLVHSHTNMLNLQVKWKLFYKLKSGR